jgi:hypothetical protein
MDAANIELQTFLESNRVEYPNELELLTDPKNTHIMYQHNRILCIQHIRYGLGHATTIECLFFPWCGLGVTELTICIQLINSGIKIKNIILMDFIWDTDVKAKLLKLFKIHLPETITQYFNYLQEPYDFDPDNPPQLPKQNEELSDIIISLNKSDMNFCIGIQPQVNRTIDKDDPRHASSRVFVDILESLRVKMLPKHFLIYLNGNQVWDDTREITYENAHSVITTTGWKIALRSLYGEKMVEYSDDYIEIEDLKTKKR